MYEEITEKCIKEKVAGIINNFKRLPDIRPRNKNYFYFYIISINIWRL